MHAFQVIGNYHPDTQLAGQGQHVYFKMVFALHLLPEPFEQMLERLTEDRIAADTVIS